MSISESWKTWIIVAVLLIFAGLASAIVPFIIDELNQGEETSAAAESHPTVTTIEVAELPFIGEVLVEIDFIAKEIDGQPITLAQAFGLAFGAVLIAVGGLGLLITVITVIFSRLVKGVYGDDGYQEAVVELDNRQKATLKEWQVQQAVAEPQEPQRQARGSVIVSAFLIVLLVLISSVLLTNAYLSDTTWQIAGIEVSAATVVNISVVLITSLILYLMLRRRDPLELESPESENQPVNWGTIWVIVTGLLIVGIGTGLAIAFTSTG